ncbi:hypothetical protein PENTCL1PPCAC_22390, partial [Pristionchus entomophagus]
LSSLPGAITLLVFSAMYSGDVPSTSGHHNDQSSFYSQPPPNHHPQLESGSSSRDVGMDSSHRSPSPHYIEMMPMRTLNGNEEEEDGQYNGMEIGRIEERGNLGREKNGEGGGGIPIKIPTLHKKVFKVDGYDMKRMIRNFWPIQKKRVDNMTVKYLREASRNQVLPLARVKKIMKIDENVQKQMIAADAPLLLSVASEMFIEELTLRSWEVTEEAKRKTLQKTDVATATARHDHMDFLIDIIPRTGIIPRPKEQPKIGGAGGAQAQMVQIVREGSSMEGAKFMVKGSANSILNETGGASTSNQQEFSARLESGEEAQVIQIGKPIPLSSQAISQLGLAPLPHSSNHHPHPHPSSSQPPPSSSHPSHPPSTLRLPANLVSRDAPPSRSIKTMAKGVRPGQTRQPLPPPAPLVSPTCQSSQGRQTHPPPSSHSTSNRSKH